jgi:NAD(P)H-hydrate epimerase
MKIVSSADMREIDRVTSERFGVPSLTLMENAGAAVAEVAGAYSQVQTIALICGKGNNGGDGLVAARKLHEAGREVRLLLLADPAELRGDAKTNYERLPIRPVLAKSGEDLNSPPAGSVLGSDLLIDAILGAGFRPPVSGLYAQAIARINATSSPVVAIDVPSGADADVMGQQGGAVARADQTVTFTAPRPAHVFGELSPETIIAPIGSPDEAIQSSLGLNLITPPDIASLLGPRPRNSNKGMYGHVLVVGGSLGKSGAAAMAGFSALRTGAGLVTIAAPRSVLAIIAAYHPELMTEPLDETEAQTIARHAESRLAEVLAQKTVLALGPGISRHPETAAFVRWAVGELQLPMVLDADGLNAFQEHTEQLNGGERTLVLTPHPGEMARLSGLSIAEIQRDRVGVARRFAREHQLILVLKGDRTVVVGAEGETWINPTGNPGMATGGTGDILTGIVAGMLAQNPRRPLESVLAAVYLHGRAGDLASARTGEHSLVATDLIEDLPAAFAHIRASAREKWVRISEQKRGIATP